MQQEIPIFFTIDDGYAPFLAVALNSAVKHINPARCYRAIVLHQGLSAENQTRIASLAAENFAIDLRPMSADMAALDDRRSNRMRCDQFTLTIFFRLFIPAMFPEYDKAIYVDSDVVFTEDAAKLFDIDIGSALIGACRDLSIADNPPLVAYTENAVGVNKEEYINSGVLLMNLRALRDAKLEERFLDLLETYHFDSVAPDQDYLNAMCRGRIFYLDPAWDAMPNPSRPPLESPNLIHYNLFSKPWHYDDIQYGAYFWHYAADCGYLNELRAHRAAYTVEMQAADSDCLARLVERCNEIAASDVTFRGLAAKGVRIRL